MCACYTGFSGWRGNNWRIEKGGQVIGTFNPLLKESRAIASGNPSLLIGSALIVWEDYL